MNDQKNENLWKLYAHSSDLTHQLTQIAFHDYDQEQLQVKLDEVKATIRMMGVYAAALSNQE